MVARTGAQFTEGLRKTRREIWVEGERVADVTTHPKLRGGAESLAAMFDRQYTYAAECLFNDPQSGELTNVSHMIPRSKDDLWRRHAGLTRLSEASMGIMGRTPDYMNMKFAAFASAPHVWAGEDGRNERGARNIVNFQRYLSRADISLTHTIIQPTIDKPTDSRIVGNNVTVRKVGETEEGSSSEAHKYWQPWLPMPTNRRCIQVNRCRPRQPNMRWHLPCRWTRPV